MKEYEFTLRFDTSACGGSGEEHVELLAEHGCEDATIGIGIPGRVALLFTREADSAEEAVLSAVRDVRAALPGAALLEAAPDFVGMTEVADYVGRSRQNIRKLLHACGRRGPAPVHEGSSSLWHLAPVLLWLRDQKRYGIEDDLLELATTTMQLNQVARALAIDGQAEQRIRAVLSRPPADAQATPSRPAP
jgi:hypothetical protein